MCVAYPGKVIEVLPDSARVDFNGSEVVAKTGVLPVKTGDRVLVHAGCIIQVMEPNEADALQDLFNDLEDALS